MSKLPAKTNGLLLGFFAKPHLVEFSLRFITIFFDKYNIGLVHTLLFWFLKIFSSMENFHEEVEYLKYYPVNIIDQCSLKT